MAKRKKSKGFSSWSLLVVGFIFGIVFTFVLFKFYDFGKPLPKQPERPPVANIPPVEDIPQEPPAEPLIPPTEPRVYPVKKTRVAIVIDDMGTDMKKLRELVLLGEPVTIAIMPNQRFSSQTAEEAHAKGLEVIMHLPMEPKDAGEHNPGTDALLTSMPLNDIKARVEEDLKTVPHASGINNHMGSKFTEQDAQMRAVLQVIKKNNMFFLDSKTSSNSIAGKLAKELGVKNMDRNVFLDNNRDVKYIKGQIAQAVAIAKKRGHAIAIGHPYPETIEALKESVSALEKDGVEIVRLSDLME